MRQVFKRFFAIFMVLGITSSIGAVSHGNNPTLSITLAVTSLTALIILNLKWSTKK